MAIESTITLSGTATQSDRTARLEIMCPVGGDYAIGIQREVIVTQNDESIRRTAGKRIFKKLSAVAAETVTVNGVTMSAAQVAGFIAAFADKWAAE